MSQRNFAQLRKSPAPDKGDIGNTSACGGIIDVINLLSGNIIPISYKVYNNTAFMFAKLYHQKTLRLRSIVAKIKNVDIAFYLYFKVFLLPGYFSTILSKTQRSKKSGS
jgi:hypothetical protein